MDIDKLQAEKPEDAFQRQSEAFIKHFGINNASGLRPILDKITDKCSDLMELIKDFSEQYNSLKEQELTKDAKTDAAYSYNKISYMLFKIVDEMKKIETIK